MLKRSLLAAAAVLVLIGATPSMAQTHDDTGGANVAATDPLVFAPAGLWAALAVTATSANVAVPTTSTAPVLIVYDNGAAAAYVKLGNPTVSAPVNAVDVVQPGGCLAVRPGANGYLAAITASGSTSLILSAGDGFPLGCGGAGSAIVGNVVINQATPGTTNGVALVGVNGAAINTGTGASASGTPRVAVSTDSPGGAAANPSYIVPQAATTGGSTPTIKSGLTAAVVVKSSAGQVYKAHCDNPAASGYAYAQLLNTASSPALGTNVIDFVAIPFGQTGGFALPSGEAFSTGISIGAATTPTGSTAVSTAINCTVTYD